MKRIIVLLLAIMISGSLLYAVDATTSFNVTWNLTYPTVATLRILDPDTSESLPSSQGGYTATLDCTDNSTLVPVALVRFTTNVLDNYYITFTATPFRHDQNRYGYTLKVANNQILVSSQNESSSRTFNFSISKLTAYNQGASQDYSLGIILTSYDEIDDDSVSAVVTIEVGPRS